MNKLMFNIDSILVGVDWVCEKKLFESMQVVNCEYKIVMDFLQFDDCVKQFGNKLILKVSCDGYDGYGQWCLIDDVELLVFKCLFQGLDFVIVFLVVEKMVVFDREFFFIGVCNVDGDV